MNNNIKNCWGLTLHFFRTSVYNNFFSNKRTQIKAASFITLIITGAAYLLIGYISSSSDIFQSNGRLELTRVDVSTLYPGRIISLPVHEGMTVQKQDIIAVIDSQEIKSQIDGAQAQKKIALSSIDRAKAELEVRSGSKRLAQLELDETKSMKGKALVSQVELDKRKISLEGELSAEAAAKAVLNGAYASLTAAESQIERLNQMLNELTVKAPIDGRIEYLTIENGAVMPAGGRIASLLNFDQVYMTIFVPSDVAGKLMIGDDAIIVLDALNKIKLPAKIVFVASEAQFTPKFVETAKEREKLVYRIKLEIPISIAQNYRGIFKGGMTGVGYVKTSLVTGSSNLSQSLFNNNKRK